MKNLFYVLLILVLSPLNAQTADEIIWNVKVMHPEGKTIDIKAIEQQGNIYDVKALQDSEQYSFLDIKAFVNGNELPVKLLVSEDQYAPLKAIGPDGTVFDIKAINSDGTKLDIKGISSSGNLIHVKAISESGELYGVKAIAPDGQTNHVKGIKISEKQMSIAEIDVYAHVKAIKQ